MNNQPYDTMSPRDIFAAHALVALVQSNITWSPHSDAKNAYEIADAMMEARKSSPKDTGVFITSENVVRLKDLAVSNYHLTRGLVPGHGLRANCEAILSLIEGGV